MVTFANGWLDPNLRSPPACTTVLVARKDKSRNNAPPIVESYYMSTHPTECVMDDDIVGWQPLPVWGLTYDVEVADDGEQHHIVCSDGRTGRYVGYKSLSFLDDMASASPYYTGGNMHGVIHIRDLTDIL